MTDYCKVASHAFDELTTKHGHADGGAQSPKAHENRSCNVDVLHDCSRVLSRKNKVPLFA